MQRSKTPLHPTRRYTSILDVSKMISLSEMDKLDASAKAGPNSTKAGRGAHMPEVALPMQGLHKSKGAVDAGYENFA